MCFNSKGKLEGEEGAIAFAQRFYYLLSYVEQDMSHFPGVNRSRIAKNAVHSTLYCVFRSTYLNANYINLSY